MTDDSYLWALKLERNKKLHIHVQHSKLLQRVQCRSHWRRRSSWMRQMLGQQYPQLVTTPSDTTVNSAHHFMVWRVDRVTSWLVPCAYTSGSQIKISTLHIGKSLVSDIAIFVLKRDVKLQLTNIGKSYAKPVIETEPNPNPKTNPNPSYPDNCTECTTLNDFYLCDTS